MKFDAEIIRGYAVQAVTDFVANGVPLSQGIAKIASAQELNPEQIKRVVEASNTVAHLKMLQTNSDRTAEFPVANYENVLGSMVKPELQGLPGQEANHSENIKYASDEGLVKKASAEPLSDHDRAYLETQLAKGVIGVRAELEKMAYDKVEILLKMEDSIKGMQKSDYPLEKLAEVATDEEFNMLAPYFLMDKSASLNSKLVFKDNELTQARALVGLVKEAKTLITKEVEKKAFLGKSLGVLQVA